MKKKENLKEGGSSAHGVFNAPLFMRPCKATNLGRLLPVYEGHVNIEHRNLLLPPTLLCSAGDP